jgi:hypothetical protein
MTPPAGIGRALDDGLYEKHQLRSGPVFLVSIAYLFGW